MKCPHLGLRKQRPLAKGEGERSLRVVRKNQGSLEWKPKDEQFTKERVVPNITSLLPLQTLTQGAVQSMHLVHICSLSKKNLISHWPPLPGRYFADNKNQGSHWGQGEKHSGDQFIGEIAFDAAAVKIAAQAPSTSAENKSFLPGLSF